MAPGQLRGYDPDGDDGRCRECEQAIAVGPCAACEAMICSDCGVMSKDPVGERVICLSCARLIADVGARPRREPPPLFKVVAVMLIIAFGAVAVSLLLSCGSPDSKPKPTPTPTGPAVTTPGPTPAPVPRLRVVDPPGGRGGLAGDYKVAARVFVFADTQLHYLFGKRTFAQSPFVERQVVEVAVRPAALDDSSDLLMQHFLAGYRDHYADHALVFLGDAADLSCRQEMDAFVDVLRGAGVDSLMSSTSNHDGFYAGNYTSRKDLDGMLELTDMPAPWTRACSTPGSFADNRMTKGHAVKRFAALLPPAPAWATSVSHVGAYKPDGYRFAQMYYVRALSGGDPGAPPAWGVFLDTVDYRGFNLSKTRGAGENGAVSHQQLRFLDRAMFEAQAASPDASPIFVLFGHHPIDELESKSKKRVLEFLDTHPDLVGYVGAHKHISGERWLALPSGRRVPQLLSASTIDAPQGARLLELQVGPDGVGAIASRRLALDRDALCRDVKPLESTTLGYTGYRILRDGTPDLNPGILRKVTFKLGMNEMESERLIQSLGALVIENELTRSWAKLYLDAPIDHTDEQRALLERIVTTRYAAGNSLASLTPWFEGRATPSVITRYNEWHDPANVGVLRIAELGVHRFGAYAESFYRLRAKRTSSPAARRYFLCHAIYAAEAEARRVRRDDKVLYIR